MMGRDKAIEAMEALRLLVCAYSPSVNYCDCKYGLGVEELSIDGSEVALKPGEVTGCPELRDIIDMLKKMTDEEYKAITSKGTSKDARLKTLRRIRDLQFSTGNVDSSLYQNGVAMGLERALAIMEDRVEIPVEWLSVDVNGHNSLRSSINKLSQLLEEIKAKVNYMGEDDSDILGVERRNNG